MYVARCYVLWVICFHCLSSSALASDEHQREYKRKIMPLGDSITEGYNSRDSYRWHLWHLIQRSGFDVDFVGSISSQALPNQGFDADHEGHYGFTTAEILEGLPSWLGANTPDIVLLHIGTNDIGRCVSPNETAKTIERIIDIIQERNPTVVVLLATIVPIDFKADDGLCGTGRSVDETVRQLNQSLDVISTDQPDIVLVDLYSALDTKSDFRDELHPNAQGFKRMAQVWFEALEPILVTGPTRQ